MRPFFNISLAMLMYEATNSADFHFRRGQKMSQKSQILGGSRVKKVSQNWPLKLKISRVCGFIVEATMTFEEELERAADWQTEAFEDAAYFGSDISRQNASTEDSQNMNGQTPTMAILELWTLNRRIFYG